MTIILAIYVLISDPVIQVIGTCMIFRFGTHFKDITEIGEFLYRLPLDTGNV